MIAVTEAIEEAVRGLIIEGVRGNLWALQNAGDIRSDAFAEYDADRAASEQQDYFGFTQQQNRPGVGLAFLGGAQRYQGDYKNPLTRPVGEAALRIPLSRYAALGVGASAGGIAAERSFDHTFGAADAQVLLYAVPRLRLSPFVTVGGGALVQGSDAGKGQGTYPYLLAGGGLEWMLSRRMGLSVGLQNTYPLVEGLDGVKRGRIHDNVWQLKSGLIVYPFGGRSRPVRRPVVTPPPQQLPPSVRPPGNINDPTGIRRRPPGYVPAPSDSTRQ